MKKFLLGFLAVASVATTNAQNPKTSMTNAAMSLEMYDTDPSKIEELEKAKNDIDYAAGHEKTASDPKVWRYRGKIYNRIAFNAKLKAEHKNAGVMALESFSKSWDLEAAKLEEKGKDIAKIPAKSEFKSGFEGACRALYNGGADAYNAQDYDLAYQCFTGILTIKPKTSSGLAKKPISLITSSKIDMEQEAARLGGMSAIQLGKPKEAETLLLPLLDGKKISEKLIPTTYSMLAGAWQKEGNLKKAKETLGKARKLYPTNQSLLIAEINIALSEGKLQELEGKLKQAVEGDKENVELHFVLGNVYDGIFREKLEAGESNLAEDFFKKAVNWYKKAAEIDPKHFNSSYSLGALHVNYSNSFAKAMNEITNMKDPKFKELETKYNELLDLGLAHLQTAEEVKPNDLGVAIALKEVYSRKNDENNYTKYKEKVEALQKKG
ncbi:tetratricopeptide repeat protein [Aureispira anguillae]|uniref:Tetratricopeptide repeat protein n=1 Tax=Aureispira anguillae TaxID=2864201 RepID=A0A916DQH1_9BACT|nr:hypothetical protein [Aureispira anguillae]BDS11169.1 hypothetical protein AsAng_0018800 [Aureispira anguillae]